MKIISRVMVSVSGFFAAVLPSAAQAIGPTGQVIDTSGIYMDRCCSLTGSFENSASVTSGYSDAVTGARQIRLPGLSGVYTRQPDEARPVMRGLSAPFGLSYEKPLFLNASVMSDTRMDLNIASSLQTGPSWSTVILGHVSGNVKSFDHNHDGFMDAPEQLQFHLSNRWLYFGQNGVQVRVIQQFYFSRSVL